MRLCLEVGDELKSLRVRARGQTSRGAGVGVCSWPPGQAKAGMRPFSDSLRANIHGPWCLWRTRTTMILSREERGLGELVTSPQGSHLYAIGGHIPVSRKSSKSSREPAKMSKLLLAKLRHKKEARKRWKQGQVMHCKNRGTA